MFGAPFPPSQLAQLFFNQAFLEALSGTANLSPAAPNRIVVVTEATGNASIPTGVTCNGVAMNLRVSNATRARIWTLSVPTGATAAIVFTGGAALVHAFGVYSLYASSEVPFASINAGSTGGNINVPAGGVVAGCQSDQSAGGGTWTGITRDWIDTAATEEQSGASGSFIAAQTPLTITISSAGIAQCAIASWAP